MCWVIGSWAFPRLVKYLPWFSVICCRWAELSGHAAMWRGLIKFHEILMISVVSRTSTVTSMVCARLKCQFCFWSPLLVCCRSAVSAILRKGWSEKASTVLAFVISQFYAGGPCDHSLIFLAPIYYLSNAAAIRSSFYSVVLDVFQASLQKTSLTNCSKLRPWEKRLRAK